MPKPSSKAHLKGVDETIPWSSWWAFADVLPDPVVVVDDSHRGIHVTQAFEKVFGWTRQEMLQRPLMSFLNEPSDRVDIFMHALSQERSVQGLSSLCHTKEGRIVKLAIDAVHLFDAKGESEGLALILKGVSLDRQPERIRQILLRMSKALHRYRSLDRLLRYVTRLIQVLMQVSGASVIFLDPDKQEFYFQMTAYDDSMAGRKLSTVRFPADKGVAGEVYRTGKPLIVPNYAKSPHAYKQVDEQVQYETRNMLDVPLRIIDRMIGVLCVVNKRNGAFDKEDIEQLSFIADVVALPIENARVNEALKQSYERVKKLNEAKERVIVHLSHELKTPLSVLSASLKLIENRLSTLEDASWTDAFKRAQRSLERLLEMEYAVEDILKHTENASFDAMTQLPRSAAETNDPEPSEHFFQQVNIEFLIHELKDPLSVIETNAQLLDNLSAGGFPEQRRQRTLGRITRSTRKVRALLEELLEVGRAEAVSFNCHPFAPMEVIQQVLVETMESHAAALYEEMRIHKGLTAQLAFLETSGIRIQARKAAHDLRMVQDETKFRQIVANLLKNAISYRRNLLLIDLTSHKDAITLSVRDDGPGVAEAHQEKIFERYTQVSPFPGIARSGHGLGLAVSRILARSLDGDITLESQLGQGALFQLELPIEFDKG